MLRFITMYYLEKEKVKRTNYDDLSSLSSSENTRNLGGGFSGSRNRSKCEWMTEILMKCGSPNGQINKIRQVMKRSLLSTTLELLCSRSSESFEQYSPTLTDLENIIKCNTSKKLNIRRRLLRLGELNVDNDHNLNYDTFDVDTNNKKASCWKSLERVKREIISSVLFSNTHSQQSLVLHSALTSRGLIDHANNCGFYYYWK